MPVSDNAKSSNAVNKPQVSAPNKKLKLPSLNKAGSHQAKDIKLPPLAATSNKNTAQSNDAAAFSLQTCTDVDRPAFVEIEHSDAPQGTPHIPNQDREIENSHEEATQISPNPMLMKNAMGNAAPQMPPRANKQSNVSATANNASTVSAPPKPAIPPLPPLNATSSKQATTQTAALASPPPLHQASAHASVARISPTVPSSQTRFSNTTNSVAPSNHAPSKPIPPQIPSPSTPAQKMTSDQGASKLQMAGRPSDTPLPPISADVVAPTQYPQSPSTPIQPESPVVESSPVNQAAFDPMCCVSVSLSPDIRESLNTQAKTGTKTDIDIVAEPENMLASTPGVNPLSEQQPAVGKTPSATHYQSIFKPAPAPQPASNSSLQRPHTASHIQTDEPVREYTDEEVAAVLNKSYSREPTVFSAPLTSSAPSDDEEELIYDAKSVDLEIDQNLPEELENVIKAYDDEIKHSHAKDGAHEHMIHLAIARVLEHAGYEKLAYVRYLKALEANSYSLTAIHELRRIARAYDKTKDVATLLQSELDVDISKTDQSTYLEEYARIVQYLPNEQDDAFRCLHQAANLTPDRIGPLATLSNLLINNQLWNDASDTLTKLAALTESKEERAGFYLMQAEIANHRLKQPRSAISKYLQSLDELPGSLTAFNQVLSLLMQQEHWQLIHKIVSNFADDTKDRSISQSSLLIDGSIASDRFGDPQIANHSYERAYNLDTTDPTALDLLLDNFGTNNEQWYQLDQVYSRLEELSANAKEHADYANLRAINIRQHTPDDAQTILDILENGYNADPQNPFLLSNYIEQLTYMGHFDKVETITNQQLEQNGTEATAESYTNLGIYYSQTLRDDDHAIVCFKKALNCNIFDRRAFENAEIIYRKRGNWKDLIAMYHLRLSVAQDARIRASLLYTMGTIHFYTIGNYEEAITCFKHYREIYPDDIHCIHMMQTLYRMTNNYLGLCELLLVEKDMSISPIERCNLLIYIAEVCVKHLNKKQFAINILQQAREENPQNANIYRLLCSILAEEKRWLEYVNVLNDVIRYLPSPNDKIATLSRIGLVYELQLCDETSAISSYERILKLDPTNMYAIKKLEFIYKKTRNISAYYDLTLRTNPFIASPLKRARRLYLVALKFVTIQGDYNQAIEVLEKAMEITNDFSQGSHLLCLCYLVTHQFEKMLKQLHAAANHAKMQETKSECAYALASIYVWILDQYADAVHPLELAIALRPNMASARQLLIQVQQWLHQPAEAALLFAEAAQLSKDNQLAIHYYKTAADIAHAISNTNTKNSAVDEIGSLKRILELDANDVIANERLEAMEPSRANLVPFFEKRLRNADPDETIELKLSIAESIYANQPQRAFALMCECVEQKPFHLPALRMASNTAIQLNNITLACRYLSMQAKCLENISLKIIAWKKASELAKTRLNNPTDAIYYLKQAFLLEPHRMDICDELVELLTQQHELQEINNILQIHVRSISKSNRISRFIQMADFYINDLKEPAQAAVKLRQILEIDHDNLETYDRLIAIELSQKHYHEASCALESLLEIENLSEDRALKAKAQLAELYVEKLHRSRQAIPLLEDLLAKSPDDTRSLHLLSMVYFDEAKYEESLNICLKLNACLNAPENISILLQMATIYKILNNTPKIAETLNEAVDIVPLDPVTVLEKILPWVQNCNELSIIRNFVECLVNKPGLSKESLYAIYKFAAAAYLNPLNMRFESDRFAVMAAQLMPTSMEAQLLAAKVFDPKEAMLHAFEASKLAPFSSEPYVALLDIVTNAQRVDMQARVEQQLMLLGDASHVTPSLQSAFQSRRLNTPNTLTENLLRRLAPSTFNPYIQELLKLAGPAICPPPSTPVQTAPLSAVPRFTSMFNEMAAIFGMEHLDVKLAYNVPFIMGPDHTMPDTWLFNGQLIQNASEAEKRCHIAAGLTSVTLGLTLLEAVSYEDISRFVSNLLGLVYDQLAESSVMNHLKQTLSRKEKRAVTDYVKSIDPSMFSFDPVRQCIALRVIQSRAALLCCADLNATINSIMRRELNGNIPELPQQRIMQASKMPVAYDIQQFNLSDDYSEIRQELNVALKLSV